MNQTDRKNEVQHWSMGFYMHDNRHEYGPRSRQSKRKIR